MASIGVDLLTPAENPVGPVANDVALLAERLVSATRELHRRRSVRRRPLACLGLGPAAAPALWAAGELEGEIAAVVAVGGKPDLLATQLAAESAPTLLVAAEDGPYVAEARLAREQAPMACELVVVGGVDPLAQPSAFAELSVLASDWLAQQLAHASWGARRRRQTKRRLTAATALATAGTVLATAGPAQAGITFRVVNGVIQGGFSDVVIDCYDPDGPDGPQKPVVTINDKVARNTGAIQVHPVLDQPDLTIPSDALLWEDVIFIALTGTKDGDRFVKGPNAPDVPVSVVGGGGPDILQGADVFDDTDAGGAREDDLFLDLLGDGQAIDTLDGGEGNDSLSGGAGSESLRGGPGDDTLSNRDGADTLDGGEGNDSLLGGADSESLVGGLGEDSLAAGLGNDTLDAGLGNDTLDAGLGIDALFGGAGDDSLIGGAGNDVVDAGDGNDAASGGSGNDAISGGTGNDTLTGALGRDTLSGGPGDDNLAGGKGNDRLEGGPGGDRGDGGPGKDVCATEQKVRCP
jgi:Ca2+-binding RTX toxin-like protein